MNMNIPMKKKPAESVPVNQALLNVITPMGLEIKRNSLVIGENTGRVYGVVRYPQKVDMGWLSKITNIPSTIVSIGFKPVDNSALISAISKSIIQNRAAADGAKDPLARQRADKAAEDGERDRPERRNGGADVHFRHAGCAGRQNLYQSHAPGGQRSRRDEVQGQGFGELAERGLAEYFAHLSDKRQD